MSRQVTIAESLVFHPTSNPSNSRVTVTNSSRAYTDTSDTSQYATISLSSSAGYANFGFSISNIPSDATITSVACDARLRCSSNNTVSSGGIQLYNNTTAQGTFTSISFTTTASVYSIASTGTWTTSNISNVRLCISGRRRTTNSSAYIRLYGADLTVNYNRTETEYEVSVENNSSTITTSPADYVLQGKNHTINFFNVDDINNVTVTDNDVDITSSLVHISSPLTFSPSSVSGSNGTVTDPNNGLTGTDSTNYAQLRLQSGTYLEYSFDTSSIPSNATITSISCQAKGCVTRTSNAATVQLYSGSTAKGSTTYLSYSSNVTTVNLTCGSWTRSELNDCRIRIVSTYTSSSEYYARFYGADLTVNFTLSGTSGEIYTYTISNISADHAIVIADAATGPVDVTGVTLNQNTKTIEIDDTFQLTATVIPGNATNKNVTWSSGNTSIATVVNGLVTGISAGTTTITVTTQDGNYTATCAVTVLPDVQYKLATSLEGGKTYVIVNTNNGSGYALSNESGGSRILKGVPVTVSNGKLSVKESVVSSIEFTYTLETAGVEDTGFLMNNGNYLYTDNSTGLRMYNSTPTNQKHWHYVNEQNILWQFKDSNGTNGYEDTSAEYKYYLNWDSSGNFTDEHITSPSISESTLPAIYLFEPDDGLLFTCTDNSTFGNITPTGTQNVEEGDDVVYSLSSSDYSLIKLTDNDVDVTSQIVLSQSSVSGSPVFVPSSYHTEKPAGESGYTADGITNGNNGLTDTSSTSYATLYSLENGGYEWASFHISVSGIPNGAIIDSVTCKVKVEYIQSGMAADDNKVQLYSGNTPKGTASQLTYGVMFNDYLNIGTWTMEELQDVRLYVCGYGKQGGQGFNFMRFYGAELTVTYHTIASYTYTISNVSVPHTLVLSDQPYYVLTCTDNSTNGDIAPTGTRNVVEGGTAVYTLTSSDFSKIKLTDNGVDVTNQIVYSSTTSSGSPMFIPSGFELGGFVEVTNVNNGYSAVTNYDGAEITTDGSTECSCAFIISVTGIPSGAIIDSVSCKTRISKGLNDNMGATRIQLYSGNTPKGTAHQVTGSHTINEPNLDTGTWTVEELQNVRLVITATPLISHSNSGVYFYGAEFTVTYHSTQGYTYNILNASIPHTLELIDFNEALHMKINGNWVRIAKVYKKINNVWTEVTLDSLTEPNIYIMK